MQKNCSRETQPHPGRLPYPDLMGIGRPYHPAWSRVMRSRVSRDAIWRRLGLILET